MGIKWLKRNPKIIIPIITGLNHFKIWKNQNKLNKFKRGIIKAAYTTELIYITNGYNIGVSKIIGDAFREESLANRTSSSSSYESQAFCSTNEFDKLILIGIVSISNLKHSDLFRAASKNVRIRNLYLIPRIKYPLQNIKWCIYFLIKFYF